MCSEWISESYLTRKHIACLTCACARAQPGAQWHRGRALLARRAGVAGGAVRCRGESLDHLGHLSADGCMRPWLPSYANLPRRAHAYIYCRLYSSSPQKGLARPTGCPSMQACPGACLPYPLFAPLTLHAVVRPLQSQ